MSARQRDIDRMRDVSVMPPPHVKRRMVFLGTENRILKKQLYKHE